MSWNGTVRCSWCYEKGHNRRGCPHLKKHWQDILEDPNSSDFQKGRARAYFAKKERLAKKAAETRRCGYCGMPGHNRKTCKVLKHDMNQIKLATINYRKQFFEAAKSIGLSEGTLVSFKEDEGNRTEQNVLGIISEIDWNMVNTTYRSRRWSSSYYNSYGYAHNNRSMTPSSQLVTVIVSNSRWTNAEEALSMPGWRTPTLLSPGDKMTINAARLFGVLGRELFNIDHTTHNEEGIDHFYRRSIKVVGKVNISDNVLPDGYLTDFDWESEEGQQLAKFYNFVKCHANKNDASRISHSEGIGKNEWNGVYNSYDEWLEPRLVYTC